MRNLNNLYNFKNPIRHFFNLGNMKFDNSEELTYNDLAWTAPVKFKIFKTEESQRTISFPNILNFYHAIKLFQGERNFSNIGRMSDKKRVSPHLEIGEFTALSYYEALQKDVFNLTKYDKLLILDIKSFYGRIYTHDLGYNSSDSKRLEQRVGSLNNGRTNGLLLGSYLSLYLAELFLLKVEQRLDEEFANQQIDCHYEYFSDDFYFFCNCSDIDIIKNIFSKVLDEFELQVNFEKMVILDFEEYAKNNNLEKLWKKIISISRDKDKEAEDKRDENPDYLGHPAFFTQLVYRLNQISELKYKRVFLANFFKTWYFNSLNPDLFQLSESDFNYICYIYKLMPEAIIYSINKIKEIEGFNRRKFKDFILARFRSSLKTEKYEEQVYFYYAIKMCEFNDELKEFKNNVLKSKNQILISYFIMDRIIEKNDYQVFLSTIREDEWLQNYHYLLTYDKNNVDILLPVNAKKEKQKKSYLDFYKFNLDNDVSILRPINQLSRCISDFIQTKIESYEQI